MTKSFVVKPSIEFEKLKNYVESNTSYSLNKNGSEIELRFSPEFPEALGHLPNGEAVEHVMYGKVENERIYFYRFTTISSFGETSTELDGEDDPVMEWLKYI